MNQKCLNDFKEAYKQNNVEICICRLLALTVFEEADFLATKDEKPYNHALKEGLLQSGCIKNPLGMNFSENDYNKTLEILLRTLEYFKLPNSEHGQSSFFISEEIRKDLDELVMYVICFYNMNQVNSSRLDSSPIFELPFETILLNLTVFYQDQFRLFRNDLINNVENRRTITGFEMNIAQQTPINGDGVKVSLTDSLEHSLEIIDILVRYIYYVKREQIPTCIDFSQLVHTPIIPYGNHDFSFLQNVSSQRKLLEEIEEQYRYGYSSIDYFGEDESKHKIVHFKAERKSEILAHRMAILRRDAMLVQNVGTQIFVEGTAEEGEKELINQSTLLTNMAQDQNLQNALLSYHPEKEQFGKSSCIAKLHIEMVDLFTKEFFLRTRVKGISVKQILSGFEYLFTLSEIYFRAANMRIEAENPSSFIAEVAVVPTAYLIEELSRLYDIDIEESGQIIDFFVFHLKKNNKEDVFSQPLLSISETEVIISSALIEQVNLDRFIERLFTNYKINYAKIGPDFELELRQHIHKGFRPELLSKRQAIPGLNVNSNKITFMAFDGRDIEFDFIATLNDYLILIEQKSMMTPYGAEDLCVRRKNVQEAVEQLNRRELSVRNDWQTIKQLVDIEMPDDPFDTNHIIKIACVDIYDFTPLTAGDVYVTDKSSLLKYLTEPYIEKRIADHNSYSIENVGMLWMNGKPAGEELKRFLGSPCTTSFFAGHIVKQEMAIPVFDEKDCAIYFEEYCLTDNPINL